MISELFYIVELIVEYKNCSIVHVRVFAIRYLVSSEVPRENTLIARQRLPLEYEWIWDKSGHVVSIYEYGIERHLYAVRIVRSQCVILFVKSHS